MDQSILNFNIAELFVRSFLGILLIFQGYDKLFVVKIKNVVIVFQNETERKNVPNFLVVLISYFTSIVEFFGGILLVIGLFHNQIHIVLCIDLLLVTFAFSYVNPMWDLKHVFPRAVLIITILLLSNYFYFGIDNLLFK